MAGRLPIVRHFIACERIVEADIEHSLTYSLEALIHRIRVLEDDAFPHIHPVLSLYALLSDGIGRYEFNVEMVY